MNVLKRPLAWLLPLLLIGGIALAACGGDDDQQQAEPAAASTASTSSGSSSGDDSSGSSGSSGASGSSTAAGSSSDDGLAGEIQIDGSSTVFPITEAVAEAFNFEQSGVQVTVGVSGTGGGFKRFCAGETDISGASRPVKAAEVDLCTEAGIDFVEIPVAFDGLTVVINPENDWVDQLTVAELNKIFRPDDYAVTWADVRDGFPDVEITIYAPGQDSGTFDYFTETVNDGGGVHRSDDTTFSEDDNVLVQGVASERGGIGYFGFSYYANNRERLTAVPIVNDAGAAVLPTGETINDGSYNPLSRPLLIYVRAASLERPEMAAFVDFYLNDGRGLVDSPEVGYVQLPASIYEAGLARVANRTTGSAVAAADEGATLAEVFGAE